MADETINVTIAEADAITVTVGDDSVSVALELMTGGSGITEHKYYDDIQGVLQTALTGVTTYTFRQYRSTGIVMPHIANSDVFSMVFQMPHRKFLGSIIESVHIHMIPIAAATGDILINYEWGWYNPADGSVVPATLPNTGSKIISLVPADQYKLKLIDLIQDLTPPTNEGYSSVLLVKCTRATPVGTNWGNNNEFALAYMDAHFLADRHGSYNETSD